jgi:TetR/AcrR family transcriptional regulator, cholesterol catabolism regulator
VEEDRVGRTYDAIVRTVLDLLESEGYDAVQLRTVAKRARVSLSTIYRFFPTRDELIVAALGRWMEANAYSRHAEPPPDASLYDVHMWALRLVFEPWEKAPRMLEAYHRALSGPGGDRLDAQGMAAVEPVVRPFLAKLDPDYCEDMVLILTNMAYAVRGRFADGDLAITDILAVLERTVFRLTADNPAAAGVDDPRSSDDEQRPPSR